MKLFFFDESNSLMDIEKFKNIKIITFDHKSHILLKNKLFYYHNGNDKRGN